MRTLEFLDLIRIFESAGFEREVVSTRDTGDETTAYNIPSKTITIDETTLNNCIRVYFRKNEELYVCFAHAKIDNYTCFKMSEIEEVVIE